MRTRLSSALMLTPMVVAFSATAALAETWVLLVQPAPYSSTNTAYASWQPYRQYDNLDDCLDAPMLLYELWKNDLDLATRMLSAVCRNESTGQIVTGDDGEDDEDDY